jgi:dTDP-4-dehydrorhamnose 3,5-epimerase-like enzyme
MIPQIIELGSIGSNDAGFITVAEVNSKVPFEIKRVYWTYNTPQEVIRGHHAHKNLFQLIIAVRGCVIFRMEDIGGHKFEFTLERPSYGLFIPPGYWRTIELSEGAVLVSLASMEYNEDDYIRDYEIFKNIK